ncbi:arylesterase [Thalassococcus sp. BH17M4-6]|uniref:arylesterase n=1 Tax=Thalassococcus sp. BH17M4-6 TaxID=3413148 RepID=UPI003BCD1EDD
MFSCVSYGARTWRSKAAAVGLALLLPVAAQAETIEVLALGDSLTAGYGLPQGDGFVPQLQTWLDESGVDARVVNAGVSGDTTAGGLARVEWSLGADTDAMIVALGGNDLLRGLDPASSRQNLDGILQVAEARDLEVLLVGLRAPGNYGPEFQRSFNAMYPELSDTYDTLFEPDFFAGLAGEGANPAQVRGYMQADGIHPTAEGVSRIVAELGPRVAELVERASD